MPSPTESFVLTREFLIAFQQQLNAHVQRVDAPRRLMANIKDVLRRFKIIEYNGRLMLEVVDWNREIDADAIHQINSAHMGFVFSLPGTDQIARVQCLRAVKGVRRPMHCYIPMAATPEMQASVLVDSGYDALDDYLDGIDRIESAVLIQHSGTSCVQLIGRLLKMGADVRLFTQNPTCATPPTEAGRMAEHLDDMRKRYWNAGGSLQVYNYNFPASARSVLIPNRFVAVGWYNFFAIPEGKYTMYGHDQPYLLSKFGDGAYLPLSEMVSMIAGSVEAFSQPVLTLEKGRKRIGLK